MYAEAITVLIRKENHVRVTRALRPLFLIDTHYCYGVRRWALLGMLSIFGSISYLNLNNCITRWRLGACSNSTFGSQPLDWIMPPSLAQPPNPTISTCKRRNKHLSQSKKYQWKKKGGGGGNWLKETVWHKMLHKGSSSCHGITWMMLKNISHWQIDQSESTSTEGALCCSVNYFKLHLNAFYIIIIIIDLQHCILLSLFSLG